jgi:predicted RNase H-like HicB family nuclease
MFLLLRGPGGEPRRMRLYVQGAEDFWTATMVGEDEPPPTPSSLQGVCFFGRTPEEAKAAALSFFGRVESVN